MLGYLKSLFAGEDVSKKRKQPERSLEDEEYDLDPFDHSI